MPFVLLLSIENHFILILFTSIQFFTFTSPFAIFFSVCPAPLQHFSLCAQLIYNIFLCVPSSFTTFFSVCPAHLQHFSLCAQLMYNIFLCVPSSFTSFFSVCPAHLQHFSLCVQLIYNSSISTLCITRKDVALRNQTSRHATSAGEFFRKVKFLENKGIVVDSV